MRCPMKKNEKGFTLVEVIVSLVVAAIIGTMLATFMASGLTKSVQSVLRVRDTYALRHVMENMTADYKRLLSENQRQVLDNFSARVGAAGTTSHTPEYGRYKVLFNGYITFPAGCTVNCAEQAGGNDILKVTITDVDDTYPITSLFTRIN